MFSTHEACWGPEFEPSVEEIVDYPMISSLSSLSLASSLSQSLSQRSKTRTSVADPGSASGGTFQCMQFLPFLSMFSYLFYLGHLSLLGLQTKTRRQSNSSTLCSFKSHNPETFMSSTASASVHAICKRSQKCLAQKVGHLGSLGWIPMIQVPINSPCVALQYETGTKFFHRAIPELHAIKNSTKIVVSPCTFIYNQ